MKKRNTWTVPAALFGGVALFLFTRRSSAAEPMPPPLPEPAGPPPLPNVDIGGGITTGPMAPQPVDMSAIERDTPTAGFFYQVKFGDILGGTGPNSIVSRALRAKAYDVAQAALDPNPRAFADSIVNSATLRTQYMDLILCSGPNDLLYGTYGYSSRSHAGPHGRSIRLLKIHPDNRARISRGESPLRNIEMLSPEERQRGKLAGPIDREFAEAFEYLWLPDLDPSALYNTSPRITTEGLQWEDGTSKMWGPPEVTNLGFEAFGNPGLAIYGCGLGEMEADA